MSVGLRGQRRVSTLQSVPSPNKGLNATDPLAAMDPDFCIQLDNWIPGNSSLQTLQGDREHCTGLGGPVKTLAPFSAFDGTTRLLAFTDSACFNVTTSTSTPIPVYGVTDGRLEHTQFSTVASNYIVFANGTDAMFMYDGSTFTTFVSDPTPSAPGEIDGVDPADVSSVYTYKRRLWMLEKNTLTAYYLPTDAVAGVATPFYLGGVFTRGGYLVDITSWSFNSGAGIGGYLVFRSSSGEVAVYEGDDPDNAATWRLSSLYFVAPPIGNKSTADLGGDTLMLTSLGLVPLSKVAQGSATEALFESTVSKYINPIITSLYADDDFVPNWELHNLPSLQGVLIVVPQIGTVAPKQFFMNTVTGAWSRWDLSGECFAVLGSKLYFGDQEGRVLEYGTTGLRGVKLDGTGGEPVDCYLFSAYTYLGNPATLKHFKMVRPIFQATSEVYYRLILSIDYDINNRNNDIPAVVGSDSTDRWNTAIWDQAVWRAALSVSRNWITVTGVGMCAAVVMRVASDGPIYYTAIDWVYEPGSGV